MTTPFQRHKERVLRAHQQAEQREAYERGEAPAIDETVKDYAAFEVIKRSLEQDVNASMNIPRGDERTKLRNEKLIPRYEKHVAAYVENGEVFANPVLVQMMIWYFDDARIEKALPLAKLAIEQNQQMPKDFKRDVATFAADEVRDWAERQYKHGRSFEPYFSQVFEQLESWPVPDVTKMKFAKFAGKVAYDTEDFSAAVKLLENADKLGTSSNPAQVTTLLAKARAKAEKA